ncbi:MAG: hypothetical protein AAF798_05420 [Bacteroidota bacterium]
MNLFVTKIVDQAINDKIDLEGLKQNLHTVSLPELPREISEIAVTFVFRSGNDYVFDCWQKEEQLFLTIPIDFYQAQTANEAEILALCRTAFQTHLNNLSIAA